MMMKVAALFRHAAAVQELRASVDLEIAPQVEDQVAEPDETGDGHDVLLANRGAP